MLRSLALLGVLGFVCLPAVEAVRAADLLRVEGRIVKWSPPTTGRTTVITYSVLSRSYLVARRTKILSPDNCGSMQPFSDILTNSPEVSQVSSTRELRAALSAWEHVADIKFVEVSVPEHAQIVIGATEAKAGPAFANLSLNNRRGLQQSADKALGGTNDGASNGASLSPDDKSVAFIGQSFVCLNQNMRWKVGFDGNLRVYDLRHAFMHEIGHAIGLDHPGRSGSVMGFRYDESVREPQPADIIAVQRLYGPPRNN